MRRTLAILCVSLGGMACQPRSVVATPTPREGARLFVYLQPFPREANRLTFRVRSVSALAEGLPGIPLQLHLERIGGAATTRERLIASGPLPAGRFDGLALELEPPAPDGARRPATTVGEPTRVDVAFDAPRDRGVVLSLRLDDGGPTAGGTRPSFRGEVPGQIASGRTAVATSRALATATVFDKSSGHVVGVIPTGRRPAGMALARERFRAYVAVAGEDSVEVIDIVEKTIIDRLRLEGGDAPVELALTPDGATLLSANAGSDAVSFIDARALFEIDRVAVGNGPGAILVDSAGQRAYVCNREGDSISVIDLTRRAIAAEIRTDAEPLRAQLSPDETSLYVIHRLSPYLVVVDPATLETVNRVYVGPGALALEVDRRTGQIYLARRTGGGIEVFDPVSLLPIGNIPIDGAASYATIDGESNQLFLVLPSQGAVRSFTLAGLSGVATIDVGEDPYWVTMMGER